MGGAIENLVLKLSTVKAFERRSKSGKEEAVASYVNDVEKKAEAAKNEAAHSIQATKGTYNTRPVPSSEPMKALAAKIPPSISHHGPLGTASVHPRPEGGFNVRHLRVNPTTGVTKQMPTVKFGTAEAAHAHAAKVVGGTERLTQTKDGKNTDIPVAGSLDKLTDKVGAARTIKSVAPAKIPEVAKGWAAHPVPDKIVNDIEAEKVSSALDNWDAKAHDFTDARKNGLHRRYILASLKGIKANPNGKRSYTMMGGGPASGKSSIIKSRKGTADALDVNRVVVNADIAKMGGKDEGRPDIPGIPEFDQQVKKGNLKGAAGYVHEESSAMAKKLNSAALESGLDVLNDGVGDGKVEDVLQKINEARGAGYKVEGVYVSADTSEALVRAVVRGYEQERYVNPAVVFNGHSKVSNIFTGLANSADGFDHLELWDTDENPPVKVAEGNHPGELNVLDKDRWNKFLAKGNQTYEDALEKAIDLAHTRAGMSDEDLQATLPKGKDAGQVRQHLQKAVSDLQDVLVHHRSTLDTGQAKK